MAYTNPQTATESINPSSLLMQGQDSSAAENISLGHSQGNTLGGTFSSSLKNPAFNPANYPIVMPDEVGHITPEQSSFASYPYPYQKPMAFGSINPFQAQFHQSGSDLPSSTTTHWNVQPPNSFVGNNVSAIRATYEESR